MVKQIQTNSNIDIFELLKQSKILIEKSDLNAIYIREQLKKMKKKSREIESLLLL